MQNPSEDDLTVWCGNLPSQIDEDILFELFLQVGPLRKVRIPSDKAGKCVNFGFVTFKHIASVPYAVQMLNNTVIFDRHIIVKGRRENAQNKAQLITPSQMRPPALMQTALIPNQMLLGLGMGLNRMGNMGVLPMMQHLHMLPMPQHDLIPKERSRHGNRQHHYDSPYRNHNGHYSHDRGYDRRDRSRRRF